MGCGRIGNGAGRKDESGQAKQASDRKNETRRESQHSSGAIYPSAPPGPGYGQPTHYDLRHQSPGHAGRKHVPTSRFDQSDSPPPSADRRHMPIVFLKQSRTSSLLLVIS